MNAFKMGSELFIEKKAHFCIYIEYGVLSCFFMVLYRTHSFNRKCSTFDYSMLVIVTVTISNESNMFH